MKPKFGYLLPTRERIMGGQSEAVPLLTLAEKAEEKGYDSVWVGDSLLARPRHEPLTMLAAIAARTKTIELGTAVLLPALRNPVVLAHLAATVDQLSEGRLILGVGIASDLPNVRAEFEAAGVPFEKRVGRMMEGIRLCQALWSGQAVKWNGRWNVDCDTLGIVPNRLGGPPIWGGGSARGSLERAGRHLDGWFPVGPDAETIGTYWREVQAIARNAGRSPEELTCAAYLTVSISDNLDNAQQRLDEYLQSYYGVPAELIKTMQACFAGPLDEAAQWLQGYVEAGASHLVLRFAGDHEQHLDMFVKLRADLGW
ncbi:MAG: F420-dependent glucose-6-phosphate dehydrogenase [Alphaproteobacteria bacterium MarineAlpha9_Bin5]|nr:MAG: F420-dependent glucose-6-phosphate dehydrogenase [Alphaproteobacteria bacterium MarineAlpha9_Bin6]PPR39345.1 MAG: F420-dependent glucose-6-phosphate dehydrogenase [Alphaproteobacteria bacterium MarineAlpha9_Bin5]